MRAIDDVPLTLQDMGVSDMPNLEHGAIGARLARYLDAYVDEHKLGRVFTSQTTFTFVGTPPTRYPDLSFVKQARLPQRLRTVADFAPDLAVEVISENDAVNDVEEKVLQYHQSGVQLVWVIKPVFQTVEVYELGKKPRLLTTDDVLTGDPVLPGFTLPVSTLFD
ncbi:MAG TPA: Uma2 family endonuclease [Chloroflexota bacterium]|nr:Uma2 family endonuclease [Chloroflexota bacterium]